MTGEPRVYPAIKTTATFLDMVLGTPEWDRLVDLNKLRMDIPSCCILGQTGRLRVTSRLQATGRLQVTSKARKRLPISGDPVQVPWSMYHDGLEYLDAWAEHHPDAMARLGVNFTEIVRVFAANTPTYYGQHQDTQWIEYLAWRRAMRYGKE